MSDNIYDSPNTKISFMFIDKKRTEEMEKDINLLLGADRDRVLLCQSFLNLLEPIPEYEESVIDTMFRPYSDQIWTKQESVDVLEEIISNPRSVLYDDNHKLLLLSLICSKYNANTQVPLTVYPMAFFSHEFYKQQKDFTYNCLTGDAIYEEDPILYSQLFNRDSKLFDEGTDFNNLTLTFAASISISACKQMLEEVSTIENPCRDTLYFKDMLIRAINNEVEIILAPSTT